MSSSLVFSAKAPKCDDPVVLPSEEDMLRFLEEKLGTKLSPIDGLTAAEAEEKEAQYKVRILEVTPNQALRMDEMEFGVLGMGANFSGPPHNYLWGFIRDSGVEYEPGLDFAKPKTTKGRRAQLKVVESPTAIVEDSQGYFAGEGMSIVKVPFRIKGTISQLYKFFQTVPVIKAEAMELDL
ncbi:MAG: hypothetical protein KA116_08860 [Proteobacteria bacterium]|nr:hypothetical protein [Pseudomonadota bacterium]